jgi:hypothetical protein
MAPATQDNDRDFSRREWLILARGLGQAEESIQPESTQPEVLISDLLTRWVVCGGSAAAGVPAGEVTRLAEKVKGLDYVRSWALLWSLQYRVRHGIALDSREDWWSLSHRRRMIAPVAAPGED